MATFSQPRGADEVGKSGNLEGLPSTNLISSLLPSKRVTVPRLSVETTNKYPANYKEFCTFLVPEEPAEKKENPWST